jgi:hypothetical protein
MAVLLTSFPLRNLKDTFSQNFLRPDLLKSHVFSLAGWQQQVLARCLFCRVEFVEASR